jgi:dipeptidyl aminopeptidase/acylaminoacyl peptidase
MKLRILSVCYLFTLLNSVKLGMGFQEEIDDPKKWTVLDVLKQESAGSFNISPDGKWVVWVRNRADKEQDSMVGDIYLSSLTDTTIVQLTRGQSDDTSPIWSPDGKYIAFASIRGEEKEKTNQIWIIDVRGGEPWQLTHFKKGVQSFRWKGKNVLLLTAREDPYYFEQALQEKKDDAAIVGDQEHFLPVRLFQVSLKSGDIERLTVNSGQITEFAVSPDGRWVVTSEAQNIHFPYDNRIPPRQYLMDLQKDTREEIFIKMNRKPGNFVWSTNSNGFYYSQRLSSKPNDDYVSVRTLGYFNLETKTPEEIPLNWKWELGYGGYFVTGEGLLTSLANGPWNKMAFYKKSDGVWSSIELAEEQGKNIIIHDVGKDETTVVYTYTTASIPPRMMTAKIEGHRLQNKKEIIKLNPWIHEKYLAKSEVINWQGALKDEVDGILYYPYNYEKGRKYPLIASIHGGPSGVDLDAFRESWSSYPNILSGRGAFVLKVNYHGSGNYSLRWVESIKEHYYEYEVPDILSGIDNLIPRGMVDPDMLGIMGWSNGAILAIQCVIETNRFKVVAPGAGDVNWTSDYGNCAFGAGFDNAYFGGPPWERPQYYITKSPLFQMKKVKTPTILFFGTLDTNVPTQQGWEHYRALQQIGKAPVRFILFPGEPHGLKKLTHQQRKMKEELAWFDTYLFKTSEEFNESLKKESPLAHALRKAKTKREGEFFGDTINDILIPEIVVLDSIRISRYEITRAQFAAFDRFYRYKLEKGNYPVTDIRPKQAVDFCSWLSEITGKQYRLPTEDEMRKLVEKAKKNSANENNLDYWAGYDVNPDDVGRLQTEIEELERITSLLLPVGSFKPIGYQQVYDLGGNAAELCVDTNGVVKVLGYSANMPKDTKTIYVPPKSEYVGFRVIQQGE